MFWKYHFYNIINILKTILSREMKKTEGFYDGPVRDSQLWINTSMVEQGLLCPYNQLITLIS